MSPTITSGLPLERSNNVVSLTKSKGFIDYEFRFKPDNGGEAQPTSKSSTTH